MDWTKFLLYQEGEVGLMTLVGVILSLLLRRLVVHGTLVSGLRVEREEVEMRGQALVVVLLVYLLCREGF